MVVAILGILAAIILPTLQGHITEAKESAAKDNLRILRNAIELYAAQHNNYPPGYVNGILNISGTTFTRQLSWATNSNGASAPLGTDGYPLGSYLPKIPANPFNDKNTTQILSDAALFPDPPTGATGWIYKPSTKTIRINDDGTDSEGIEHYDY
jgi:type II secretory pathway pseudopilin PulG